MDNKQLGVSPYSVNLSRTALREMIVVVRSLQNLSEKRQYLERLENIQENTRVDSNYHAVLMGYDFHITESQQAKLIEVNTNAGGLGFASRCYQPSMQQFPAKLAKALLQSFLDEFSLFCSSEGAKPRLIAIVDQQPQLQFLFLEMQMFATLFQEAGIAVVIIDPSEIDATKNGLFFEGKQIDLIYNRHCDFYLKSAEMRVIEQAWRKQQVCLTPNPRVYGLLADKQRMVDWSTAGFLNDLLSSRQTKCLQRAIPQTRLLSSFSKESLWMERKKWVFKPANGYASRGVYVGAKLTKNKFNSLDSKATLVQQRIKPSVMISPEGVTFKTDFRLFVYRKKIMAVSARLYQGQVTNLRTKDGGFCRVNIE